MKHGDFTNLASQYSQFRPGYSETVLNAIFGVLGKAPKDVDFTDVGAGTGIWTRMVAARGVRATAVEPNAEMRRYGMDDSKHTGIQWLEGSAEQTGLADQSADLVTMASSFHWPDFDKATSEFRRILRPGGVFAALWNTRLLRVSPMLVEIENKLKELVPDLKRVSSGSGEFCSDLTDRLLESGKFADVLYLEGRHVEKMTPERYMGIWRSVNDIQVQAGPERFEKFMDYIGERISGLEYIDATYLTRTWACVKA